MFCIRVCVLHLYVCSAVYETRTYGAMRGAGEKSPHLLLFNISIFFVGHILREAGPDNVNSLNPSMNSCILFGLEYVEIMALVLIPIILFI